MPTSVESSANLGLQVQQQPDAVVLFCEGQIVCGETAQAFRTAVLDLLQRHHNLIVDLGGVDCMDRSGLETLVSLYSSARTERSKVQFVNLTVDVSDSRSSGNHLHKLAG